MKHRNHYPRRKSPLRGIWVRFGTDLNLRRIGTEFSVSNARGEVIGDYSGPPLIDVDVVIEPDEVEVWLVDKGGCLVARGKALIDLQMSEWGVRGSFRSSGPWETP